MARVGLEWAWYRALGNDRLLLSQKPPLSTPYWGEVSEDEAVPSSSRTWYIHQCEVVYRIHCYSVRFSLTHAGSRMRSKSRKYIEIKWPPLQRSEGCWLSCWGVAGRLEPGRHPLPYTLASKVGELLPNSEFELWAGVRSGCARTRTC